MNIFDDDTNVITKPKIQIQKPKMYTVIFLNDDFTPMQFVVHVLSEIFHLNQQDAISIMMKIHKEGKCNVGSYTFEIASHKATLTVDLARKNGYPLQAHPEAI